MSMSSKFRGRVGHVAISGIATVALLAGGVSGASAIAATPSSANGASTVRQHTSGVSSFKEKVHAFAEQYKPASAQDSAHASQLVQGKVKAGALQLHLPAGSSLSFNSMKAYSSQETIIAVVPIAGSGLAKESSVSVQIVGDSIQLYREMQFTPESNSSGHVEVWQNAKLIYNQDVSAPSRSSAHAPNSWWSDFVNCMENEGVPGWVMQGISAACGVVCATGVGCVPCALGVAVLYGNQVLTCAGA